MRRRSIQSSVPAARKRERTRSVVWVELPHNRSACRQGGSACRQGSRVKRAVWLYSHPGGVRPHHVRSGWVRCECEQRTKRRQTASNGLERPTLYS
eukprot:1798150-Prymnesium_polylepis.2